MKMKRVIVTIFILIVALSAWSSGIAATTAPATAQSSQTDTTDNPDAKRLTFLGDQLTADEAAIDAINRALLQQGYKVAVENDKAADAAEGNQLMDRKGGAPVRWQDFYGRTAKDFIMHDKGSPIYYQVQRPTQFDYVYHANDTQIEEAKSDVAAIGQKVDALLAQRKKLEAEQSALWAQLAFESIGNRDIPRRPLYRDQLQADPAKFNDNHPEPPTVKALAAAVLYLRTADAAATDLESKLDTDQGACYVALRDALNANFKSLQESEANFEDAAGDNPTQLKQMADTVSIAKSIPSLCTDLCEAYGKAQDAEQANEDARRQLYRRTMQDSLLGFAEAVGRLDDQLEQLSASWDIKPEHGKPSADKVPQIDITPTPNINSPPTVVSTPTPQVVPSASAAASVSGPKETDGKGHLWLQGTGPMGVWINGNNAGKIDRGIGSIDLALNNGDSLVIRASSSFSHRFVRFAYINGSNEACFVSVARNVMIHPVADASIPPVAVASDATVGHSGGAGPRSDSTWKDQQLPNSAEPIYLPDRDKTFDLDVSVALGVLASGQEQANSTGASRPETSANPQSKTLRPNREATPPAAANAPARPALPVGHGATDLLKEYVSGQTVLPANWSVSGGELRADDRAPPLSLACNQTGPFDVHVEYTPLGAKTGSIIRFKYKNLNCSYLIYGNAGNGFSHDHIWTAAHTPDGPLLSAGTRYSIVIQVRDGSACAFLDGKMLQSWTPNDARLKVDPQTPIAPSELTFALLHAPAIVHVLEVQMPGPGYVDTSKIVPVQPATPPATVPSGVN